MYSLFYDAKLTHAIEKTEFFGFISERMRQRRRLLEKTEPCPAANLRNMPEVKKKEPTFVSPLDDNPRQDQECKVTALTEALSLCSLR